MSKIHQFKVNFKFFLYGYPQKKDCIKCFEFAGFTTAEAILLFDYFERGTNVYKFCKQIVQFGVYEYSKNYFDFNFQIDDNVYGLLSRNDDSIGFGFRYYTTNKISFLNVVYDDYLNNNENVFFDNDSFTCVGLHKYIQSQKREYIKLKNLPSITDTNEISPTYLRSALLHFEKGIGTNNQKELAESICFDLYEKMFGENYVKLKELEKFVEFVKGF